MSAKRHCGRRMKPGPMPHNLNLEGGIAYHCKRCGSISIDFDNSQRAHDPMADLLAAAKPIGPGRAMGDHRGPAQPVMPGRMIEPRELIAAHLADRGLSDEQIGAWLVQPHEALDRVSPADALDVGRFPEVFALIS